MQIYNFFYNLAVISNFLHFFSFYLKDFSLRIHTDSDPYNSGCIFVKILQAKLITFNFLSLTSTPKVVAEIYKKDIKGSGFSIKRIMMLEFSQYLENFLWPNFEATKEPSLAHVMSIVLSVNEKFRERVPAWAAFQYRPDQFPALFQVEDSGRTDSQCFGSIFIESGSSQKSESGSGS